ncbi:hypothetical protein B7463_g3825, partial [Scytalidium lignicola]
MSSGSRSRTGCYTCRIRKKKCDEQYPCCGSCQIRKLQCYGYDAPPPDWMHGKRGWKEIMATEEARQLRSIAEVQYKARRRNGQNRLEEEAGGASNCQQPGELTIRSKQPPAVESIWWDSGFCSSLPIHKPPHEDARLLKLFLDFIFPIQFGFYPMSTTMDHSWLMSGLCSNKARYHAALSVSACFDASLREPEKVDGIGLSLEVTERQANALCDLRTIIAHFNQQRRTPRDMVKIGMQILEVMHQLLSLEIFSMLEGTWELHHQATRTLLNTLHTYSAPELRDQEEVAFHSSPLEMALKDFSSPDTQRTLEFHVTCVVWVDIIANATFGSPSHIPRHFDYIPYLHANGLKTQDIMGCHSSVMANIAEITCLADWKTSQLQTKSLHTEELSRHAISIATRLVDQAQELEQQSVLDMTKLEAESRLVTLQFACAAQVYLHVVVFGADTTDPELVLLVNRSLQMLEALPNGLMIRVNWAFTILGCMASKTLYDRFRGLITRIAAQKLPLGMTWKGLIVMEECWRLRQSQPDLEADCDWKRAMNRLGTRILLV